MTEILAIGESLMPNLRLKDANLGRRSWQLCNVRDDGNLMQVVVM